MSLIHWYVLCVVVDLYPHLVLHHSGGVPAQRGINYATTHTHLQ